ncbi:MAG: tRNA1Val (adenine37-N6)-methyltransferase [Saprospiraceae bacterium]|jgi:tRNA1Val (adenine37-N6)-methyltransferase
MFQFKQFSISDSDCGMKIGVDGVLLGAWIQDESPANILDVGTGSGLIALMMAQKFPKAIIHAVEIESDAIKQASKNFINSPFDNQFITHEIDFLRVDKLLSNDKNTAVKFDIIVANLPYFDDGGSFIDSKRDLARSSKHLPLETFFIRSIALLENQGSMYFIYPNNETDHIKELADQVGFQIDTIVQIQGNPDTTVKRCLYKASKWEPSTNYRAPENQLLVIEIERGKYTKEYKELCKDFYLKF